MDKREWDTIVVTLSPSPPSLFLFVSVFRSVVESPSAPYHLSIIIIIHSHPDVVRIRHGAKSENGGGGRKNVDKDK